MKKTFLVDVTYNAGGIMNWRRGEYMEEIGDMMENAFSNGP